MLVRVSSPPQNRQGTATRALLVETAERLFAEQGVDAVSVRAVNAAAGVGAASVHYHFGAKDELLRAVVMDLGAVLAAATRVNVDVLAAAPEPPTPESVVRAVTGPYLELLHQHRIRGMRWIKIVAQTALIGPADDIIDSLELDLLAQVRRAFPDADPERLQRRWAMVVLAFAEGLSRADEWGEPGQSTEALDAFYEDLVAFMIGGAERMLNS